MFGLLNVNKPLGVTSRDVVNQVQRLIRPIKVGHAGTLDPIASGILVLTLGPATRLTEYIQRMPKTYVAEFQFGRSSDTDDSDGVVTEHPDLARPTLEQIRSTLGDFVGEIQQRPPSYSAIKVKGRRAYQLARAGQVVALDARTVRVDEIELLSYDDPILQLRIVCGAGTYIRSLGRDLAHQLGTRAIMTSLERTAIGPFTLSTAVPASELDLSRVVEALRPPADAVVSLRHLTVDEVDQQHLRHGRTIQCPGVCSAELAAFSTAGSLVAILTRQPDGSYHPGKNFAT